MILASGKSARCQYHNIRVNLPDNQWLGQTRQEITMKAYSVAKTELSDLRELYRSSSYAFAQAEEVLRYRARCQHHSQDGATDQDLVVVQPIKYKLKASFRDSVRALEISSLSSRRSIAISRLGWLPKLLRDSQHQLSHW